MKNFLITILCAGIVQYTFAQVSTQYTVSFENAVHHEAQITATFKNLNSDTVEFRMSRSSPGRYALHEFAKNVYDVNVTDGNGKVLKATRPDPYSWNVKGHNGTLIVSYTLFANHGDGTYAQIDETHAHLNAPPTFMYAPELKDDEVEINFIVRDDLNWKVSTQLKHLEEHKYYAPNFQYFMDSPIEISDHKIRSFEIEGQKINFALHSNTTDKQFDSYFNKVKKIVIQQIAIFGELPAYDFGEYTFLACYAPQVSSDGMEHRNSTVLTNKNPNNDYLSVVSHELFHGWNAERIRPASLEPFDFTKTNMSGELWFAEGFTKYYEDLVKVRAGLITKDDYILNQGGGFNYVWTSTGRIFFNPIEMSYKAPFNDAASSIDEENNKITFISYYYYGKYLALALDLSLREIGLNLDDYMKLVWETYGKAEKPYSNENLHETLNDYAGADFGNSFFNNYIYDNKMPDFNRLLKSMGVDLAVDENQIYFGTYIYKQKIGEYPEFGSTAYEAGLTKGDKILKIGDYEFDESTSYREVLKNFNPGDAVNITFERFGQINQTTAILQNGNKYNFTLIKELDAETTQRKSAWLDAKTN